MWQKVRRITNKILVIKGLWCAFYKQFLEISIWQAYWIWMLLTCYIFIYFFQSVRSWHPQMPEDWLWWMWKQENKLYLMTTVSVMQFLSLFFYWFVLIPLTNYPKKAALLLFKKQNLGKCFLFYPKCFSYCQYF